MKYLTNFSIVQRLFALLIPVSIVLFMFSYWVIGLAQTNDLERTNEIIMDQQLTTLSEMLENTYTQRAEQRELNLRLLNELQNNVGINPEDSVALAIKQHFMAKSMDFEKKFSEKNDKHSFDQLRERFYAKKYFETGFTYVIDPKGNILIHPYRENENILSSDYYREMLDKQHGVIEFFDDHLMTENFLFYRYFENIEQFVCIQIPRAEMYETQTQWVRILWLVIAFIFFVFWTGSVLYFMRPISKSLRYYSKLLRGYSLGHIQLPAKQNDYRDEINDLYESICKLGNNQKRYEDFLVVLREGYFENEVVSVQSIDDKMGYSISQTHNILKTAYEDGEKRRIEDEKRKWESEGLAMFNELLRITEQDIESFSYKIIKGIAEYIAANQGALYLVDTDGIHEETTLKLVAAHAYEQQKFIDRSFGLSEGLVGACAFEKQMIFMTDIPADYVEIRSGLGGAEPSSLLFVPILLENAIFGVLELASLGAFEPHECRFVEMVANSIASSLANVKNSVRTQKLLSDAQVFSDQMMLKEELMKAHLDEVITENAILHNSVDEVRLREKKNLLFFEKSIVPIMAVTESGKINKINNSALHLFGIDKLQAEELYIQELIIIKDMKHFFSRIDDWQAAKALHTNGSLVTVSVYTNLVAVMHEKLMLVYILDNTNVENLERKLSVLDEENIKLRKYITDHKIKDNL